jgi:hypothetical protein
MAQLLRLMSTILMMSVAATGAFAKGPFGSIHVGKVALTLMTKQEPFRTAPPVDSTGTAPT